jgi:hypothetical protein
MERTILFFKTGFVGEEGSHFILPHAVAQEMTESQNYAAVDTSFGGAKKRQWKSGHPLTLAPIRLLLC